MAASGTEAHRDRRELPEVRHQARVRVGAQAPAAGLAAEAVQVVLREPALEERPGVDARRRVTLEVDLVAAARVVLAAEEVVEAHLVQAGRRGVGREVTAEPGEPVVRPQDHRHGVPADQPPDAPLQRLVAREPGLLLGADRVDVAGLGQGRDADVALAGPLQQLVHQEAGAVLALLVQDLVQGVEPLAGLDLVDVGQLLLEVVDVHRGSVDAWATLARAAIRVAPMDARRGRRPRCGRVAPGRRGRSGWRLPRSHATAPAASVGGRTRARP